MEFQSAPHFSSEANTTLFLKSLIHVVSLRASLQQRGERAGRKVSLDNIAVSIRASLQQRGEPGARQHFYWSTRFQSAPHFSSEANSIDLWFTSSNVTFQSAPHFSSEANATDRREVFLATCFNPRLTSAARRTHSMSFLFNCQRSFNPRLTSAARRTNCRHRQRRILEFQSAPHFSSEANSRLRVGSIRSSNVSIRASLQQRGELLRILESSLSRMFQSAPHFSSEANASDKHFPGDLGPFQSAPHFSSEANLARKIKIEGGFDAV